MKKLLLISSVALLAACESAPPSIQTGPDAETTFDGLVRVNNAAFQRAWVDPEIDLSSYSKIMPGEAKFEYKAAKKGSRLSIRANASQREFAIEAKDQAKFEQTVSEVFDEEMAKSKHYTMTDKPGPDTLIVRGGMLDIINRVPPEMTGMHEIYVNSFGEVTLVLEVVDSVSGEVLARAVERRALKPIGAGGGDVGRASGVTIWAEVRRVARMWAKRLREGLDSFHQA